MDRLTAGLARLGAGRGRLEKILIALLLLDVLFMVLHLLHVSVEPNAWFEWPAHADLGIDQDRGYAELTQYLKLLVIIVGLVLWFVLSTMLSALSWAGVFGFALLDDALKVHESGGVGLATALDLNGSMGLRPQDFGELLIWATAGFFLGLGLLLSYLRAGVAERRLSMKLAALLGVLVGFGLVLDMLHSVFSHIYWSDLVFTLVEDGGEMVTVSVVLYWILSYVVALSVELTGEVQI